MSKLSDERIIELRCVAEDDPGDDYIAADLSVALLELSATRRSIAEAVPTLILAAALLESCGYKRLVHKIAAIIQRNSVKP